jgi:DMSO/TMAO reductase YedYZ molybdopterin-dependent catalytic subunit
MIHRNRNFVLACAVLCGPLFPGLLDPAIAAPQAATSPVSILVIDASGARIPHASIRVVPSPDATQAKMQADEIGQLSLNLNTGRHALFVEARGFKAASTDIDVQGTKEVQIVQVRLEVAAFVDWGPSPYVPDLAPVSPSTMPAGQLMAPADELRVSAYTKQESLKLKIADLKPMPRTTVTVHNEHSKADETYAGVRLADVLAKLAAPLGHDLRGAALSGYLVATGSDGYVAVIALAEVDPTFHSGEVLVADTMNGAPLDAKSGPFKLVVTEDKRPARWVRNLVSIELKSAK